MSQSGELRISNADRERVIAQLRQHTTDGRLTLDEFGDRVGEVFAAKTFFDLELTLRELPHESVIPFQPRSRRRVDWGEIEQRGRRALEPVSGWPRWAQILTALIIVSCLPLILLGIAAYVVGPPLYDHWQATHHRRLA